MSESTSALSRVPSATPAAVQPASTEPMSAERIAAFYATAKEELKVLQRAAVTNMMYSSDRLVVERDPSQWILQGPEESQGQEL